MKRKKLDITSLDRRLKILQWEKHNHLLTQLANIESNTYNHFKKWTPLKLCGLSYFAGGYVHILENLKNKQFSGDLKIIYIDLFSGCGINQINHVLIAGSPLVCIDSVTNSNVKFDKMFFNDAKSEYSTALVKRLEFLSEKDAFAWIKNKYYI